MYEFVVNWLKSGKNMMSRRTRVHQLPEEDEGDCARRSLASAARRLWASRFLAEARNAEFEGLAETVFPDLKCEWRLDTRNT